MELVEVVRGPRTDDATAATLVALARRAGKVPVLVRDAPGFLVNRVLFPYLSEALVLLEEGATPEAVDAAAEGFGMPCGPVRLCDLVGLDVTRAALAVLEAAYPDRARPTRVLEVLTTAGRLGRKSGAGFHAHARGTTPAGELLARCRREDRTHPPEELLDRLLLPLVAEAVRVLEDGVADSAAAVDLAMILGTGFPAFRGGPLRWADGVGLAEIVARLRRYAGHGGRFAVPALLGRLAASGGRFHASA
jgi:3-hydroxyacyl-CoA dehydrogenase/enoyl-CoA hydratase/3-hydroxybutyryl-CoA epimerase/3-hydroxyacyl-CoA dehydrogenase/enoyl-CoA hydratase/3-hydroxybutyryl-CoA epimerase/enoyl-CoA isomerase